MDQLFLEVTTETQGRLSVEADIRGEARQKGEEKEWPRGKADYLIRKDGKPLLLVEAKSPNSFRVTGFWQLVTEVVTYYLTHNLRSLYGVLTDARKFAFIRVINNAVELFIQNGQLYTFTVDSAEDLRFLTKLFCGIVRDTQRSAASARRKQDGSDDTEEDEDDITKAVRSQPYLAWLSAYYFAKERKSKGASTSHQSEERKSGPVDEEEMEHLREVVEQFEGKQDEEEEEDKGSVEGFVQRLMEYFQRKVPTSVSPAPVSPAPVLPAPKGRANTQLTFSSTSTCSLASALVSSISTTASLEMVRSQDSATAEEDVFALSSPIVPPQLDESEEEEADLP